MARRFLSRRSRGGSSFAKRKFGWASRVVSFTANGTVQKTILCDVADYFGSASNAKHAGTLTRIRGNLSLFDAGDTGILWAWGIVVNDVGEAAADLNNPLTAGFGADEDVLTWWIGRIAGGGPLGDFHSMNLPIDVRVKRRLEVESEISLVLVAPTDGVVFGNFRSLIQLV